MKHTVLRITVLALALASSAVASNVTNIELRHEGGGVAAYIAVDGAVRFIHQMEPAKDGKPDRVIVDVLSATHALNQRNYTELPAGCGISAVRTSQYAVQPEKMVRVVFDMNETPLYSVTSENGSVKVVFTGLTATPFPVWSSAAYGSPVTTPVKKQAPVVAAKPAAPTADAANSAIEQDRQSSLAAKPVPAVQKPVATAPPAVEQPKTPAIQKPTASAESTTESPKKPAVTVTPKARPTAAATPTVQKPTASAESAVEPPMQPTVTPEKRPSVAATPKADTPSAPALKKEEPRAVEEKTVEKATPAAEKSDTGPTAQKAQPSAAKPAPVKAEKQSTPASASASDASSGSTPPPTKTSRFRRAPTTSSKLKGTMVAEFPKRLVIKYSANRHRDPFATLINDTRTNDNPVEQRVPNVEGLRLVGIIEAVDGANRALFQDKENYSYILKSGDKVKNGYVLRVERDRVYFQIFEYGWSRTIALQIEE